MHVILDLDETLIHASLGKKLPNTSRPVSFTFQLPASSGPRSRASTTVYVYKRPWLAPFLRFLFSSGIHVSVYTAATRDYCTKIVNKIFTPSQRKQLKCVLARENLRLSKSPSGYVSDYDKCLRSHGFNLRNTVLVDDRLRNIVRNKGNGIIVPAWEGRSDANVLKKLKLVLSQLDNIDKRGRLALNRHKNPLILNSIFR